MNLHFDSRRAITLLFVLVSLGSLVYAVASALNYNMFYQALSEVESQIERVSVEREVSSGSVSLMATVLVSNPTGYSGLRVRGYDLRLYFIHLNLSETLFADGPLTLVQILSVPLGPRSTISSDVSIHLLPEQSISFSGFNDTYSGQIGVHVTLRVQINTFLDPVIGFKEIEETGDFPLKSGESPKAYFIGS